MALEKYSLQLDFAILRSNEASNVTSHLVDPSPSLQNGPGQSFGMIGIWQGSASRGSPRVPWYCFRTGYPV